MNKTTSRKLYNEKQPFITKKRQTVNAKIVI